MASQNKQRQEMIEMMYLVLTAMLALNVSKSVLEAFVAIEENIQIANENAYFRAEEKKNDIKEVANLKSEADSAKASKAKSMLSYIDKIDEEVAKRIILIDDIKKEILTKAKENMTGGDKPVLTKDYDPKFPARPARLNLANVQSQDNFDIPMEVLGINKSLTAPERKGKELWDSYTSFKSDLIKIFVESSPAGEGKPAHTFVDPKIEKFKDMDDLKKQINAAIEKSNVPKDEKTRVADIYASLCKNTMVPDKEGKEIHWVGKTFDHSPLVAALAALSSLETEILTARADVIAAIQNRVGGGEFSFNKVKELVYGPDIVNSGDSVNIDILMAAYDSDHQPKVVLDNGEQIKDVSEGQAHIRTKAGGSEMNFKGTISIMKKDGTYSEPKEWEKKVIIMTPSASLTLPELMVLYKGYKNIVQGTASGYDQTVLSASAGISLVKEGDHYVANVGNGAPKQGTITVSGKSTSTGKTASLRTFDVRIQPMPAPTIFVNGNPNNVSKNATVISASYGPGIPLKANFSIISWEAAMQGAPRLATGAGASFASARSLLSQGQKGARVAITAKVKMPGNIVMPINGAFILQ